ncbi:MULTISPECIES: hypothetical protein [Streptosporangium]|uniref:Uncharacterized protein n=1 Tax=Streptosporangium brasiliense TaxID=47480 RepID=A0ABT9RM24_9ACTN|nr:hypothetical protein [Streptosporangium brasiliense]MDP9870347.1 hypothetical protein [Streptosporangium brasiliense]
MDTMTPDMATVDTEAAEQAAEQVAAGAIELDDRHAGWWEKIDKSRLNQADVYDCVLGQLYRFYWHGRDVLRWCADDAENYGVYVPGEEESSEVIDAYRLRTHLWIAEIDKREAAAANADQA